MNRRRYDMPTAKILNEALIRGNRTVKAGDIVELLPLELSLNAKGWQFIREWLGEGPYIISRIGQWPCGKIVIYLKTSSGDISEEPWAPASDFI
ncbi:MAG: hypothetical protein NTW46_00060 [Candidatus Nealsonbacteria bacterium]|nr:hypothetical protein [Candidatus Nealsonbacteria bacterium]